MELFANFAYQLLLIMKRMLKLAVFGIAISAFVSCRNGETRNAQTWPEWFETATPFDKDSRASRGRLRFRHPSERTAGLLPEMAGAQPARL